MNKNNAPLEYCSGVNPYLGSPLLDDEKMSFCCTLIYDKAVYLCTDSTVITRFDDGRPEIRDDNYVKIAVIPNANIAVVVGGLSKFGSTTVEELIRCVKCRTCVGVLLDLSEVITPYELSSQVMSYYTVAGYPIDSNGGFGAISAANRKLYDASKGDAIYAVGPKYVIDKVQEISDSKSYLDELKKVSPQEYLNKLANEFVAISNQGTKTIGGSIRILKLTPNGVEWLQNKPE